MNWANLDIRHLCLRQTLDVPLWQDYAYVLRQAGFNEGFARSITSVLSCRLWLRMLLDYLFDHLLEVSALLEHGIPVDSKNDYGVELMLAIAMFSTDEGNRSRPENVFCPREVITLTSIVSTKVEVEMLFVAGTCLRPNCYSTTRRSNRAFY